MFFWNFYALFYNKLNELIPYKEHVSNVLKLVKVKGEKKIFGFRVWIRESCS